MKNGELRAALRLTGAFSYGFSQLRALGFFAIQKMANAQKNEQRGDPDKLAELVVEVVYSENPPLYLAIGEDATAVLDRYCDKLKTDTDAWRAKAVKTTFE